MNFIRYNPETGDILSIGWMSQEFIDQEISEGKSTIAFDGYIEHGKWKVNLTTKELEEIK